MAALEGGRSVHGEHEAYGGSPSAIVQRVGAHASARAAAVRTLCMPGPAESGRCGGRICQFDKGAEPPGEMREPKVDGAEGIRLSGRPHESTSTVLGLNERRWARPPRPGIALQVVPKGSVLVGVLGPVDVGVGKVHVRPVLAMVVVEEEAEGADTLVAVGRSARLFNAGMDRDVPQTRQAACRLVRITQHALEANVHAEFASIRQSIQPAGQGKGFCMPCDSERQDACAFPGMLAEENSVSAHGRCIALVAIAHVGGESTKSCSQLRLV